MFWFGGIKGSSIFVVFFFNYYSAIWHYPLKFYVGRLHVQHASWPAGGSKAPLLPPPNGAFVVIWKRVSLYVASPRSLEQGWQRSLGGLHKCIMNNWVGEARDCRWHSKAVICLDVSDCFYSLMGALPIKAQFTASHEVARIHPSSPRPFPPPCTFKRRLLLDDESQRMITCPPLCYWVSAPLF